MISINLYLGVLGDLLVFDWGVQLTTGRVQRRSHDKVDKDLKKTVNQSNRRKGILPKTFKDIDCRRTECLKMLNRRRIKGRGEQLSIIQSLWNWWYHCRLQTAECTAFKWSKAGYHRSFIMNNVNWCFWIRWRHHHLNPIMWGFRYCRVMK